jgi:phage portal protein BeeE
MYHPGGMLAGNDPVNLAVGEVAHFAPIPDPIAFYRGMSWLTPVVREIQADSAATLHKLKFFENGATPNIVIKHPPEVTEERFKAWLEQFRKQNEGVGNAYKTLALGGGADVSVVGTNLQQLDFKVTQGAGETRIAAAAGVPPVIVGLSEGLQGSSLNAGNYGMARRRFADGTMRPLWRNAAGSLQAIIDKPSAAELWYDDRDIPFLQEDMKDAADIIQIQMTSIRQGVEAGFEPDAVVEAVSAGDVQRLAGQHSGLSSVQLQPPATGEPAA